MVERSLITLLIAGLLPLVDETHGPQLVLDVFHVLRLDKPDGIDVLKHRIPQDSPCRLTVLAELRLRAVPAVVLEANHQISLDAPDPVLRRPPKPDVTSHTR